MKITKQTDGMYTIEAEEGKALIHDNGIKCKRAVDQTEAQVKDWREEA